MVIRDGESIRIQCDICEKPIPPQREIMNAGGLMRMGWACSGGKHLCPAHQHPDVVK